MVNVGDVVRYRRAVVHPERGRERAARGELAFEWVYDTGVVIEARKRANRADYLIHIHFQRGVTQTIRATNFTRYGEVVG